MSGTYEVDWSMNAEVNGVAFRFVGKGVADLTAGTTDVVFSADPGFPEGFDPVSCPKICGSPLTGFAATSSGCAGLRDVAVDQLLVNPFRNGLVHDAAGKELLRLHVTTSLRVSGQRIVVVNEMFGMSHLPRIAGNLRGEEYLLPNGAGRATGVCHFELQTEQGDVLHGRTTVPYAFGDRTLPAAVHRVAQRNDVEWLDAQTVRARFASTWQPVNVADREAVRSPALV